MQLACIYNVLVPHDEFEFRNPTLVSPCGRATCGGTSAAESLFTRVRETGECVGQLKTFGSCALADRVQLVGSSATLQAGTGEALPRWKRI